MLTLRAHRKLATLLALLTAIQPPTPAAAEHIFARIDRMVQQATYHGTEPESGVDCAVETLAENIDWLEHHIDTYGSIVAKSPDIWGEARLTKFRDEYEKIMFRELTGFQVKINASIAQSDSAFLAQALALSAAAGEGTQVPLTTTFANATVPTDVKAGSVAAVGADAGSAPFQTADGKPTFSKFGIESGDKISLEPVIELDQLSRYLNHLHELRRINEGDDTSDSPGYSLNLVRIPVSILPGKLTRTGFGAEITVTCTPVITDDLMPTTFHNLAINDMVDLLGLPLVRTTEALLFDRLKITQSIALLDKQIRAIDQLLPSSDSTRIERFASAFEQLMQNKITNDSIIAVLRLGGAKSKPLQELNPQVIAAAEVAERSNPGAISNLLGDFSTVIAERRAQAVDRAMEAIASQSRSDESINLDAIRKEISQLGSEREPKRASRPSRDIREAAPNRLAQILSSDVSGEGFLDAIHKVEATKLAMPHVRTVISLNRIQIGNEFDRLLSAFEEKDPNAAAKVVSEMPSEIAPFLQQRFLIVLDNLRILQSEEVIPVVPTGRARRALNPLNPTFVVSVIGFENLLQIAGEFNAAYNGRYIRWNGGRGEKCEQRVDLLDAQRFLQAELEAAHELLSQPDRVRIFHEFASPNSGLARQIRDGYLNNDSCLNYAVEAYRHCFFRRLHDNCPDPFGAQGAMPCQPASYTSSDIGLLPQPGPESDDLGACIAKEGDEEARNTVEALAWALVVESALLNERLNLDVRKIAKSKEAFQLETQRDYLFFLPETVMSPTAGLDDLQGEFQEATDVFKEYVRVRWPIHVFAVDPREQDQNVADVSARKRELQFALALGFVTGQIGVNSLTQYSRELQTQIETIALNRTIVGFGHGDDTFGWRFQPRVQGLFVPNNCGAVREILCGVSRDYDLRHRQLEPGQRECTAIVLMPSFVPYADFDIRSNWYKLTNPKNSALTMRDTLRLSRAITTMRQSQSQCQECAELYREKEVHRLLKRVDQLDRELPLQTQRVLVPYENTLGGFEMFNTGVTDLSPELIGWYGAPGVVISDKGCNQFKCGCTKACSSGGLAPLVTECVKQEEGQPPKLVEVPQALPICEGEGTTLFLVGDNFSVHDTKVIAGGVCIPHVQLVSRQVMRVTIPSCVQTVSLCENGKTNDYVAIYLATPYGITNHLHVPVQTQLSAESKSQIEQAVAKQVTEAVAKLEVSPRHLAIAPALEKEKNIFLDAECDSPTCTTFKCKLAARSVLEVRYTYQGDPRFDGAAVTFYVAPCLGDKFLGGLQEVQDFPQLRSGEAFAALGKAQEEVLTQIGNGLRREDFKDGKAKLKLVYYARIKGQQIPERLLAEIPVEVTLQLPEVASVKLTTSQPGGSILQWQTGATETTSTPPAAMPLPADSDLQSIPTEAGPKLKSPATEVAPHESDDCRCGQFQDRSTVQRASHSAPLAPRRLPAEHAQFQVIEQLPGLPSIPVDQVSQEVNARLLAEIELLKQQIAEQQVAIQAALEQDAEIVPAAGAAAAGQSIINVNIQQPSGHCSWLSDQLSCPLTHQMFVRSRECWRNVRDQIPCN